MLTEMNRAGERPPTINSGRMPSFDSTPAPLIPSGVPVGGPSQNREATGAERLVELLRIDLTPSDLVSVDHSALCTMAKKVLGRPDLTTRRPFSWDDPTYWLVAASPRERSQYFAVGTAINFRFWRVRSGRIVPAQGIIEGQTLAGAMYMWRCLRLAVENGRLPLLDAEFLAGMTEADFIAIFSDDTGRNPLDIALMDRIANLRDLGRRLCVKWDGDFWNVIQASAGDLATFCTLSRQFRAFDDSLAKLTMLNAILHVGSGLALFNCDPLPAIDYHLVKQLLRQGVLIPIPRLRDKLVDRQRLTRLEASELRRVALGAFLELGRQTGLSGNILDNMWWGNRRVCSDLEPACTNKITAVNCPFLKTCAQLTDMGMPLEHTRYY